MEVVSWWNYTGKRDKLIDVNWRKRTNPPMQHLRPRRENLCIDDGRIFTFFAPNQGMIPHLELKFLTWNSNEAPCFDWNVGLVLGVCFSPSKIGRSSKGSRHHITILVIGTKCIESTHAKKKTISTWKGSMANATPMYVLVKIIAPKTHHLLGVASHPFFHYAAGKPLDAVGCFLHFLHFFASTNSAAAGNQQHRSPDFGEMFLQVRVWWCGFCCPKVAIILVA